MEKFERKKDVNISSIDSESIDQTTKATLSWLKNTQEKISKLKDVSTTLEDKNFAKERERMIFDEMQVASPEGMEHINSNNAHLYHENKSNENNSKTR